MDKRLGAVTAFFTDKKRVLLFAAALFGVLLMLLSRQGVGGSDEGITLEEYKQRLEADTEELCEQIKGVGRCTVRITFSEGESREYRSSSLVSSSPPRVLGVAVVCDGGESDSVREAVTDCMTSLFDVGANRVSVLKMR